MKLKAAVLLALFAVLGGSAFGQGGFIPPQVALETINGITRPIAGATITVCAASVVGFPCSPPLVNAVFKDAALTRPLSNPFTADANGNYYFAILPGTYTVTVTASGFAGHSYQVQLSSTCAPIGSCATIIGNNAFTGSNTHSGTETFTGAINCTVVNAVRCISPSNPQGWAGSDAGAWINSAITTAGPIGCSGSLCTIQIARGTYNFSTQIQYANGIVLEGEGPYASVLNYSGSAIAVNMGAVTGAAWNNLGLTVSNANAVGIRVSGVNNWVANFHLTGTSAQLLWITGYSGLLSSTVFVTDGKIENFSLVGIQVDHAIDIFLTGLSVYSAGNSTTSQPLLIDTGVSGLYVSRVATGWGKHGLTIQNLNGGGAYGASPIYLWFDQFLADTCTGGDCWLFDSSLGTNVVSAHFTNSWAAFAGHQALGAITTPGANGVHISGGQGIYIGAGSRIRLNAGNGILIDSANVANVTIEGNHITENNEDNSRDQHGIYVTANASNIGILNNRIGNILDFGVGNHQIYGIKIAAGMAPTEMRVIGNDLGGNVTGALFPTTVASYTALGNLPSVGAVTNQLYGGLILRPGGDGLGSPLNLVEGTSPGTSASSDICYGDSTAHALKCSFNNGTFFQVPQTIASGTASMTTALIATLACGTTVTVAATGVLTTDVIDFDFNAAVTGANNGLLIPHAWPTVGNVNFNYCNPGAAGITPTAMTVNWSVRRP